jgi:hypothetical protein
MKRLLLMLVILSTSLAVKGQDTIPQKKVIGLMSNYNTVYCKWDEIYEKDKTVGFVKTIEIETQDTSISSIFFYSNVVKEKNDKKLEVVYAEINNDPVEFIVEIENEYSVKNKTIFPVPMLEAEMTRLLQTTKPGFKKRK